MSKFSTKSKIPSKFLYNCVKFPSKFHLSSANFRQNSSNFRQNSVKFLSNFGQNSIKFPLNSFQIPVKIRSEFRQNSVKIMTNCLKNSLKFSSKFQKKVEIVHFKTSYQPTSNWKIKPIGSGYFRPRARHHMVRR